ncbi:MAG: YfhO family protein [Acidobacteria bacterium]|nr:YfhO family protein [Acidobacteriota bacterium]
MRRLGYVAAIALGIVLIFWKITLSRQFTWMNGDDTVQQVLPWLQMQAREWRHGQFPLLDPYVWCGQSLIGQTQPGAMFPLNWLLFLSPMTHGRLQVPILNAYFVLIHVLGAWAMFALLRMLRVGRPAAAVAAVVFGGGGYMATVDWPQMLNGAIFLPVVLLFWIRYLRAPGKLVYAATAGVAAGAAVLAGHHSAPVIILATVAGLTLYSLVARRSVWVAGGLAVFGLFFFLVGAAQSLPAMEYWRVSYRFVNAKEPVTFDQQIPFAVHRHYSLDAASLPGLVINGFHRDAALNPFLGAGVMALAVMGFLTFRRTRTARIFLFLAVYSLFLAFGENSILHGLFYARFPMFDKLRNPSMLVLGVHISLIVLAAFGLEAMRKGRDLRRPALWLVRIGGVAFVGLAALYVLDPAKAATQQGAGQFALFSIALGSVVLAPVAPMTRMILAALLMVVETGSNSTKGYPDREMGFANFDLLSRHDDVAAFLPKGELYRITIDESVGLKNFGDWYGMRQVNGFMGMSINMFREQWRPELPALLGARFHLGEKPRLPDQVKRFTGRSGVSVWESAEYAPLAWTAHGFERIGEGELAERYQRGWPAVREPLFALTGEARPAVCDAPDRLRLSDIRGHYGRIEATMACDGLVVFSSAMLPGWEASVDGQPRPILEAYGKLMAVSVPAGEHTVEFRYAPRSITIGCVLTLVGLIGAGVWWWISGRPGSVFRDPRRRAAT